MDRQLPRSRMARSSSKSSIQIQGPRALALSSPTDGRSAHRYRRPLVVADSNESSSADRSRSQPQGYMRTTSPSSSRQTEHQAYSSHSMGALRAVMGNDRSMLSLTRIPSSSKLYHASVGTRYEAQSLHSRTESEGDNIAIIYIYIYI